MSAMTFFMIVTPRDVVIGDYAIRSYQQLQGTDHTLLVYSNYLLPEQKAYYFPRWEQLPRTAIQRNDHHDPDLQGIKLRIKDEKLEGPFEYCDPIWDRELPRIDSDFVATVDADFEILSPRFVYHMLDELAGSDELIGYSTDYSPTAVHFESFTQQDIILNERNHTWFCLYRREAFQKSSTSHAYHQEIDETATIRRNAWDSSAYFQQSLRNLGYRFGHLDGSFRRQYVHYGAFSKNTTITRRNVALFRRWALLEHWLPPRFGSRVRWLRGRLMPGLENNRNQWVREVPIQW